MIAENSLQQRREVVWLRIFMNIPREALAGKTLVSNHLSS